MQLCIFDVHVTSLTILVQYLFHHIIAPIPGVLDYWLDSVKYKGVQPHSGPWPPDYCQMGIAVNVPKWAWLFSFVNLILLPCNDRPYMTWAYVWDVLVDWNVCTNHLIALRSFSTKLLEKLLVLSNCSRVEAIASI